MDNSAIIVTPGSVTKQPDLIDENGVVTTQSDIIVYPSIRFQIGYLLFKDKPARLASDTDPWIKFEAGQDAFTTLPFLPIDWTPKNVLTEQAERIKAMAYVAMMEKYPNEWVSDETDETDSTGKTQRN